MLEGVQIQDRYLEVPIIQGGMGIGVSLAGLASAVCEQGGMGVISAAMPGFKEPDFKTNTIEANVRALKKEIKKAKEAKRGLLGVNVMVASQNYGTYVRASIEAGADAIISGAGLPLSLPEYVEGKALMAPIVSSGKAASLICRRWQKKYECLPDFVVIEGSHAGGHLGFKEADLMQGNVQSLEEILKDVQDVLQEFDKEIPIFVAGGIESHEDIVHYIDLGASGVQMATSFILTKECDAHPNFKKMILDAKEEDIAIIKSPAGFPGRAIRNEFIKKIESGQRPAIGQCLGCMIPCKPATTPYCITQALVAAVQGDMENGLFFTGSSAANRTELTDVETLMKSLVEGGKETL